MARLLCQVRLHLTTEPTERWAPGASPALRPVTGELPVTVDLLRLTPIGFFLSRRRMTLREGFGHRFACFGAAIHGNFAA
jgi:hypothetical protein